MSFKTNLCVEQIIHTKDWRLVNDLVWKNYVVPAGFKTDLTTFWFEGRHTPASVLHDYLLLQGHSFKFANRVMNEAMKELKVKTFERRCIMVGITLKKWSSMINIAGTS